MIDANCPIWKAGKGFCWAPSAAWGCTDQELCGKCKLKQKHIEESLVVSEPHAAIVRKPSLPVVVTVHPVQEQFVKADDARGLFVCDCGRRKKSKTRMCIHCSSEKLRRQVYIPRKRAVA